MRLRWPTFSVGDLDAYERRHRLNVRAGAVGWAWLISVLMFMDERVRVRDGIIALIVGALAGLAIGIVLNRSRPELPDGPTPSTRRLALILGGLFVALLALSFGLQALLGSIGWTHEPARLFGGGALMVSAVAAFLRAPATARFSRRRYEADLAEVAGDVPPRPA
jgi:hypothetical protein